MPQASQSQPAPTKSAPPQSGPVQAGEAHDSAAVKQREFESAQFIRARLHGGGKSALQRYRELVVGGGSIWRLFKYELITSLLGPMPGALGLLLRKMFYPRLFKKCGKGVIFGRSVVIRNAQNIELGERVLIDDYCLLDGRGGDEEPVKIEDRVILNRGVIVQAKIGTIRIGEDSDIGSGCCIIAQGGVYLGKMVSLGGNCDIGGGLFATESPAKPAAKPLENAHEKPDEKPDEKTSDAQHASTGDQVTHKHRKLTKGPVRIGDRTVTGMAALVLDDVTIGADCIIGGGAVIRESIPDGTVVTPHQRLIMLPRESA